MSEQSDALRGIADGLERLRQALVADHARAPAPQPGETVREWADKKLAIMARGLSNIPVPPELMQERCDGHRDV